MSPLFKRDDKTTIAELEEYYANQKNTRRSKAWMMGLLSFLITVGVITSLFFAGRWGYQELTKDDATENVVTTQSTDDNQTKSETEQTTEPEQVDLPTFDSDKPSEQGVSFGDSETDNPEDLVVVQPNEGQGVVSDEAASITVEPDTVADSGNDSEGVVADDNSQPSGTDAGQSDTPATTSNDTEESGTVAGDQTSEIPNTGTSEIVVIILITAISGYLFSRSRQIAKN